MDQFMVAMRCFVAGKGQRDESGAGIGLIHGRAGR